jgi:hypothetical protein
MNERRTTSQNNHEHCFLINMTNSHLIKICFGIKFYGNKITAEPYVIRKAVICVILRVNSIFINTSFLFCGGKGSGVILY